jgi:hypothetical protein
MIYAKPLDLIKHEDIERLVELRTGESIRLEFKDHLKLGSAKPNEPALVEEQNEFLADVSAFANAQGGDLIFGINCDRPTGEAVGFRYLDYPEKQPGKDILGTAIDNALRRLEPALHGVQTKFLERDGKFVLILRIPRSANGPHRTPKKTFHIRDHRGKTEMSVQMLRRAFHNLGEVRGAFRKLRDNRMERPISLGGGTQARDWPKWVIHFAPVAAMLDEVLIPTELLSNHLLDRQKVYLPSWRQYPFVDNLQQRVGFTFPGPFLTRKTSSGADGMAPAYIHIQRTGLVEVITPMGLNRLEDDSPYYTLRGGNIGSIPNMLALDERLGGQSWIEILSGNLEALGLYPPWLLSISMTNSNCVQVVGEGCGRMQLEGPVLEIEEQVIRPHHLKDGFDAIFNAFGQADSGWNPFIEY